MNYSPLFIEKSEASKNYSNIHISIYIPKTNEGIGSYKSRNKVRFCMSLRKIEKKLLDKGISFLKVRELIKPLGDLVTSNIWHRHCGGIAIFAKGEKVKVFSMVKSVPQKEIVAETFYTEPLKAIESEDYERINTALKLMDYKEKNYFSNYQ